MFFEGLPLVLAGSTFGDVTVLALTCSYILFLP